MNAMRKLTVEEDDELSWGWVLAKLIDESQQIHTALAELQELGNPDWTACLTLWSMQFQGFQLIAQGDPSPTVRAKFERALTERRRVMDAILMKIRAQRQRLNG